VRQARTAGDLRRAHPLTLSTLRTHPFGSLT